MRTTLRSLVHAAATVAVACSMSLWACAVSAQTVLDSAELYPGEKALYEAAKKEGMVVSFDTGPTWANWSRFLCAIKSSCKRCSDRSSPGERLERIACLNGVLPSPIRAP